jgi:predicted AlkP superfamily pyrophosphatase or phosphodiesterase
VTDHVIVVSIDGLRPDAVEKFGMKNLQRLIREGSATLKAQTIYPSKTLPSHTSMVTGVGPEVHGITWNKDRTDEMGVVGVPTMFELAKAQGFQTAGFFAKSKFHTLERPNSLDHFQAPNGWQSLLVTRTVADVADYLDHAKPNLLFVHIGEADFTGHAMGWMSRPYGWAVKMADAAVGEIIESADDAFGRGNYTLIVTADHGGHGKDHGSADPQDMTIPWIAWGKGVAAGTDAGSDVHTTDTAATVLWLLGVSEPATWTGDPVTGAFTAQARLAAGDTAAAGITATATP